MLLVSFYGLATVVVLGTLWLVITALMARSKLDDLDNRFAQVRAFVAAGDVAAARKAAEQIPSDAQAVHDLTTGPAWWTAAQIPLLGEPVEVARGTAAATGTIGTQVVPELVRVSKEIDPNRVRAAGNRVDLAALDRAAPVLQRAATSMGTAVRRIDALPASTWFGAVDRGRATLTTTMHELQGYVDAAARVSRVLPTMLGEDRPQRYFVGLQNEAELRGTGGLPGAFAIAVADQGVVRFVRFESNAALRAPGRGNLFASGVRFGRDYQQAYGRSLPTQSFYNSNVSPDFRYAARIWAGMYEKLSGQRIDGVLALDPTVLAYFLAGTGPVTARGQVVSAQNVVALLQRDQYQIFRDDFTGRKEFVVDVLRAVSQKVTSGAGSGLAMLQAATASADQQRLLAWSRDPEVQRAIVETHYGGTLPPASRALAGLVLNNASGGKIDFYLTRELAYTRTGCGSSRDIVATVKLTNNAPASGLPPYVVGRADDPPPGAKPGDVRQVMDFYASAGAQLLGVTMDGRRTSAAELRDLGRPLFRMELEIPRGTTRTIILHLREPAGDGRPAVVWQQPGVTPLAVTTEQQSCG
ncbi:DUF4012 domain-containing protein [Jatrophihabitans fulvus]